MRAEATLQWMHDFYSDLFPTRKHALDHLFCTIGNGYDWVNGELVEDDKFSKRYRMIEKVEKAVFDSEEDWWRYHEVYQRIIEEKKKEGATNQEILRLEAKYYFKWYPLSKKYSYLFNYPKDIKPDWKALLDECRELLIADGINLDKVGD